MKNEILKKNSTIGIICNDAGASNLILGWLKNNHEYKLLYCLDGPAKKIFQVGTLNNDPKDLKKICSKCDLVITGTSFKSRLEHKARQESKKLRIPSIAILDHWVNYKKRFLRNGVEVFPDIIWVFDNFAEDKAKKLFKEIKIERHENYYLKNCVNEIKKIEKNVNRDSNVLYVLEPIRSRTSKSKQPYEFQVLNYFFDNLNKLKLENPFIKLRPHPSDEIDKYDKWIENKKNYNISLTINKSLEEDIAWSNVVVGYETFALVVANAASRRCITSIPPNGNYCRLRLNNLEYLREMN